MVVRWAAKPRLNPVVGRLWNLLRSLIREGEPWLVSLDLASVAAKTRGASVGVERQVMRRHEIGQIYYEVTFADPSLKIPRLEPMMFVGTNLFPDDEEEGVISYYFRDATAPSESEAH